MKQAVIFDTDGVIADSEYFNVMAKHLLLKKFGIEVEWKYHDKYLGTTHEFMWTEMKREFGLPEKIDYYITEAEIIRRELIEKEGMKPMPGVVDFISRIHKQNIPMAVASSSSKKDIIDNLTGFGIINYFQTLVSGWDCKKGKPDPEVFLKAAEELGIMPEKCVVIEDSSNGVKAAKAAGMKCIAYTPIQAAKQDVSQADQTIDDFEKLSVDELIS